MKVCRGFTLIELMVTIAVLAILATVGIPGFVDLVQNNRVTTQANELVTALNVGRTEAVKRGRPVQVVVAQAAPGWTATVSVVGDAGPALRVVDRTGSMITVNSETVVFQATGVPQLDETFVMEPSTNCKGERRRRIVVGPSGQVTTTREACL
jgi:type IV fimbrial biogenesis protein FimT